MILDDLKSRRSASGRALQRHVVGQLCRGKTVNCSSDAELTAAIGDVERHIVPAVESNCAKRAGTPELLRHVPAPLHCAL